MNSAPFDRAAARLGRDRARQRDVAALAACRRRPAARRACGRSPRRDSRPLAASPSPSRTIREKASITANPLALRPRDQQPAIVGAEIERGIVPRLGPACPRLGRADLGAGRAGSGVRRARHPGGAIPHQHSLAYVLPSRPMRPSGAWGEASASGGQGARRARADADRPNRLDPRLAAGLAAPAAVARSSNGKTTDSDSVN